MNHMHVKYLLVGGGVASSAAAQAIRALDAEGSILLVGQEQSRPYHRAPLSKQFLLGKEQPDSLFVSSADWYRDNHVELSTGRRVERLDPARNWAITSDGCEITYDRMLIATGAAPQKLEVPGADLPNLLYLRTMHDADRLHTTIDVALKAGKRRAVIIGAGLLGVELASTLTQVGLKVELITLKDRPLHKVVGETVARRLTRVLNENAVLVRTGSRVVRLDGDGRVQRVVLSDGTTIDCDFTVAAVGVLPAKQILRNTPILSEKAILVDQQCLTNIDGVYAAGDCAAVFDPRFGKHRHLDHWHAAMTMGVVAGTNMAGGRARFESVNRFSIVALDMELQVIGESRLVHHRLVRGNAGVDSDTFAEIGVAADGRIAQVVVVGKPADVAIYERLVQLRLAVTGNEERLKDPRSDLTALVR